MAEHLMVDDDEARKRWRRKFEAHVEAVMRARGQSGRLCLVDTELTAAMVQAYHEGPEGAGKRLLQ